MLFISANAFSQAFFKKHYRIKKEHAFYFYEYKSKDDKNKEHLELRELECPEYSNQKEEGVIIDPENNNALFKNSFERKTETKKLSKDSYVTYDTYLDALQKKYVIEKVKYDDAKDNEALRLKEKFSTICKKRSAIKNLIESVANRMRYSAELTDLSGKKFIITAKEANYEKLKKVIGINENKVPDFYKDGNNFKYKGNVLFEKEKLFVNIWNFPRSTYTDYKETLYYTLSDGQTLTLGLREWTATALTIPFKYRPKDGDNEAIPNAFSVSFNGGLFGGYTIGRTKFHHRKKVGNRTITEKITFGAFIGAASETLTKNNTNGADKITGDASESIGLLSRGVGVLFSRDKISVGLFMGWDKGIGSSGKAWDYDGLLWLGAGIGYDIFKL